MTRCKVNCYEVTKRASWKNGSNTFAYDAKFGAVTSGSKENEEFFASTPSATFQLTMYKDDLFIPGKSYYVDFTEAE